ncbi:DinB family protein [Polaromonas sp.]|uniref:DinB family protein n=1 Tax=Polaromonas sp. TaxID=1869339 RepID=UPI002B8631DD|nr:DinB family protein [Polaromonas sp.]HQS31797.1 DinB family protein [Polaromonas sp.]HQS91506.1 DinB family protein [Polaromonas sp.]
MARYNRWLNERLYDACETLTDADRKRDRGAFFGSIHQTLHRGAVTTLLTQAGVEVGVTDRIALASSGTAQQSLCF